MHCPARPFTLLEEHLLRTLRPEAYPPEGMPGPPDLRHPLDRIADKLLQRPEPILFIKEPF